MSMRDRKRAFVVKPKKFRKIKDLAETKKREVSTTYLDLTKERTPTRTQTV